MTGKGDGERHPEPHVQRAWRLKREGQGMTEFAFALPVFMVMMMGLIEFAWAIYGFSTAQSAANEGVRRAMVINRPATNYSISGNQTATNLPLSGITCDKFGTVLQSVACSIGVLPANRITVDLTMPNPTQFPNSGQNVPPLNQVIVQVHYSYVPLVAYPFGLSGKILNGYATAQTQ